jgi:predicted amidohydrolase
MNQTKKLPPVRLGMAQMLVEFSRPKENMLRATEMIAEAAGKGCQIVVLPEVMDLGWPYDERTQLAAPVPGERSEGLAQAARRHGIYVLSGLTELAGPRVYNACVLISSAGELLHVHRKINPLTFVEGVYGTGDRLGVVRTPMGTIGVDICADSFVPHIPQTLCRMGADMILSPSAWAVPGDHDDARTPYGQEWLDAYGSISREYDVAFVGVSNVGQVTYGAWKGWRCIGCSLAMAPGGAVLAKGTYGADAQELIVVEFEPIERPARGSDWHEYLKKRG